jgi:hypothetical protein
MKIYFSGSIRGGRQDADLYKRLIDVWKIRLRIADMITPDDQIRGKNHNTEVSAIVGTNDISAR